MSTIRKTPVAYVTMLYRQREPLIFYFFYYIHFIRNQTDKPGYVIE